MRALASALVAVAAVAVLPGTAMAADETATATPSATPTSVPSSASNDLLDARAAAIHAAATLAVSASAEAKAPAKVEPNFTARTKAAIRATRSASIFRWGSASYAKWYAKSHIDAKYGWGTSQFGCLVSLWNRESHWNFQAVNRGGRAFGIPQTKIGSIRGYGVTYGTFMDTPELQVQVGAAYIKARYGDPCSAYAHSRRTGWY